jgi:hypothetical protein
MPKRLREMSDMLQCGSWIIREQALGRFRLRFVGHVADGQAAARHQGRPSATSSERAQAGSGDEKRCEP